MKISTQALKFINEHYHSAGDPAPNGVDDLLERLGAQLGAVEEVIPFGKRFEGVIVVKIITCEDHPNADRLHVCKIDDGGKAEGVERDENGHVQVVCGAPNARAGITVAWLPPGATVPNSYDSDPFVLEARSLRGVVSNGMLASPRELSLGDNHDGILEIAEDIAPGAAFADAAHLRDDYIIDIENKMFTHRPDCFGWLGVAREIEGIYHRPYKSPEWYQLNPEIPGVETDELPLEFRNELPELVPRFTAITIRDVKVGPSPLWLQTDLARAGVRSINNIVDYTNFFMLETGQPLHAYDYDKVRAQDGEADHATIVVRAPHEGEKLVLLNGKEITPRAEAILIATEQKPIGLGGVMGGADTEVDENTTNIILECANFNMYSIRRTAMAHGLFTDAVTRFNKGQSPLQNLAVLGKIISEIRQYAGGKVASILIDDNHVPAEAMERGSLYAPVTVTAEFINARLGVQLSADEIAALLTNVEFAVQIDGESLTITAPFWRTDIEISEDIVEEVGRLYGYDHLPLVLPKRDITPAPKNRVFAMKDVIRRVLSRAGANEVLTYSFVHGDLLDKVGQACENVFQIANALSPDLQYYRLSLLPSLLEKVHANIKAGYDEFALFELGKTHELAGIDEDGLPLEFDNLALAYAARKDTKPGAAYYEARNFLDELAHAFGVQFEYVKLQQTDASFAAPFDLNRSAMVRIKGDEPGFGFVGEFKPSVRKALKLPEKSAGFEIGFGALMSHMRQTNYIPLSRFPKVEQDICLKVTADTTYQQVFDLTWNSLDEQTPDTVICTLSPVDIYQREDDAAHKQITLRLSIASYERTLTDEEVSKLLAHVAEVAKAQLGAERI
ncbi:MAG TPA: phenylalanine--tRNA ligase subunit beta [Candidatus Saccharimonadales bacterium]|nr:phenylalanine--tRNA ligase subunit beta [Candidatus Saccharimonadales bacterium]